ncbi:MAG: hypothetical protein JXB48_17980 [Candidatus Latescibacteria bacterium]|nr:hypothetical protein [Candidatus Latescibacterota bacterium]
MSDIENYNFEEIRKALPKNDKEAEERYNLYKSKDPFSDIPPALLNTADIIDYIISTGMIYPFYIEKEKFKSASYAVSLKGEYQYWDENNKEESGIINDGDILTLRKNSITFVSLEPYFRIPEYIALRFNFKITLVYKGLLLGTGPLVDPGFNGRLHLPIHNLTKNEYPLIGGEDLIYIEFTKLSQINKWLGEKDDLKRRGIYIPFDPKKISKRETLKNYLNLANQGKPIASSIPEAIKNAEESAKNAAVEAEKAKKNTQKTSIIGAIAAIALIISLVTLYCQTHSLVVESSAYIQNVEHQNSLFQDKVNMEVNELKEKITLQESFIDSLLKIIDKKMP